MADGWIRPIPGSHVCVCVCVCVCVWRLRPLGPAGDVIRATGHGRVNRTRLSPSAHLHTMLPPIRCHWDGEINQLSSCSLACDLHISVSSFQLLLRTVTGGSSAVKRRESDRRDRCVTVGTYRPPHLHIGRHSINRIHHPSRFGFGHKKPTGKERPAKM